MQEARSDEGLPVADVSFRDLQNAVEDAQRVLRGALKREEEDERQALAERQAAVTAELLADDRLTEMELAAIIQDCGDRVLSAFYAGVQAAVDRDIAIGAAAVKAREAGLPEAVVPSWAFDPQRVEGFDVSPFRGGLLVDGQAVLPQPVALRQRQVFDAVVARLTGAASMPGYEYKPPAGVAFQERPVAEGRVSPRGEQLEAARQAAKPAGRDE